MKTGFKEPNAIKGQKPADKPVTYKEEMPSYDMRTSRAWDNGKSYGTGINQPVGHTDKTKMFVDALPQGRVSTMGLYGKD